MMAALEFYKLIIFGSLSESIIYRYMICQFMEVKIEKMRYLEHPTHESYPMSYRFGVTAKKLQFLPVFGV